MGGVVDFIQDVTQKVVSWFIDIPEIPDSPQVEEIRGVQINKQSNNAQIPVIYGERLVGGTRVFLETSGPDNNYLYGAIVLCEGEINAITEIQVNDDVVTFNGAFAHGTQITSDDSKYADTIVIQPFYGTDVSNQPASSLLSTLDNWTANHKLSRVAYIAFRFTWDSDKYTGIPNIKAKVQGRKVSTFDSGGNETTNVYTTNPVWCLLDYLRNYRYGKDIADDDIDISSFYNASVVAETQVTPYSGGSDINLFDCNAVINTNKKIIENVKVFLRGMRGLLP